MDGKKERQTERACATIVAYVGESVLNVSREPMPIVKGCHRCGAKHRNLADTVSQMTQRCRHFSLH